MHCVVCGASAVGATVDSPALADAARPQVAFLDDSPLARWVWEAKLKGETQFVSFAGPKEFWAALQEGASALASFHTIITDHYFAPDEEHTGVEFAAKLREHGFSGRILLASNGAFSLDSLNGIVDKIVDKQPVAWADLI
jgi:CheY-like chemotaxis protein